MLHWAQLVWLSEVELARHDIAAVNLACAAELPGAEAYYRVAAKSGCLVTCGHSNSSWSEMERAFRAGMRHVDHFWCAMSSVPGMRLRLGTPMQGSMAEFVLMHREMSTEVIADGYHLARGFFAEIAMLRQSMGRNAVVPFQPVAQLIGSKLQMDYSTRLRF